jgi:transposase, IS5 family
VQAKPQKRTKTMHQGTNEMYRYDSGQIRVDDFEQPIGMNIRADYRWVQRARRIPWEAIEKRYARLFPSDRVQ